VLRIRDYTSRELAAYIPLKKAELKRNKILQIDQKQFSMNKRFQKNKKNKANKEKIEQMKLFKEIKLF
jgi:hypothetical protein